MTTSAIQAKVELLIRKPAAEVFEAFVNPEQTSQFWFSRGSGRLEPGAQVRWTWDMFGVSSPVTVREVEPNRRILLDWGEPGQATTVEWTFTARPDGTTMVKILNWGFAGAPEAAAAQAVASTEGFALVLIGAKALLEQGVHLHLMVDKFPDGLPPG